MRLSALLLAVWPEALSPGVYASVEGVSPPKGLMPRSAFQGCCCQCPHPNGEPPVPQASTGDPPALAGRSGSVSWRVTAPFPWTPNAHRILFVPSKSGISIPPKSCGSPVIKSHWPSKSDSLGIPSPFVRPPGWEAGCDLPKARELLWHYCAPLCRSPTWRVCDLILL